MYRAIFMLSVAALVGVLLMLLSANQHSVTLALPMLDVQVPLNTLLLVYFIVGFAVSLFFYGWGVLHYRRCNKELKDKFAVLEQEILHLRRNAIQD